MSLPSYDKAKRRKNFEMLPKGAYVIKIKNAKERDNKSGNGKHIAIAFDIAEGEYANFYQTMFDASQNEDKKWPMDAVFYLNVPEESSMSYVWDNWNTFFADVEDSNNGFVFSGDLSALTGKLIGGKFALEQTEYNGNVYDHVRLKWTCVAADVRSGKAGRMPKDKLVESPSVGSGDTSFMTVPENAADEVPF